MDAVGAVDVGVAGGAEHHGIPLGLPCVGMGGRVGVVIGLDLDDHAAGAINQQSRPDQLGRDLKNRPVEKASPQLGGQGHFAGAKAGAVAKLQHV